MSQRIPQSFIDTLLSRTDIVDIVSSRLTLKKTGSNYVARCPFHDEKTPSFTVSPEKQFYHCFGCGAHGTAIGFMMEYDRMTFVEAVHELASRLNIDVPYANARQGAAQTKSSADFYQSLATAQAYYQHQLRHHPQRDQAIDYLKNRGLSGEITRKFGIGFAPPGWRNLAEAADQQPRLRTMLCELGLLGEKNGRTYDRFRHRIMFPIHDQRGRIVGFGGRVINDADSPKYLNSPESAIFHKGRELYGLYQCQQAQHSPRQRILVVEGYMDVVALAQFGIDYAVATLGTALTAFHLTRLLQTTREIVFCFDGDKAGRSAAHRALDIVLPQVRPTHRIGFLFLPEGDDPDTFIRRESQAVFEQKIANAITLSTFIRETLADQTDVQTIEGRARYVEAAANVLGKLPDGAFKDMLIKELSAHAKYPESDFREHLRRPPSRRRKTDTAISPAAITPAQRAIAILLKQPELATRVADADPLAGLQSPGAKFVARLIAIIRAHPGLTTAALIERFRDSPLAERLQQLAGWSLSLPETHLESEFLGSLARLKRDEQEKNAETLLEKARQGTISPDEKKELTRLLSQLAVTPNETTPLSQ